MLFETVWEPWHTLFAIAAGLLHKYQPNSIHKEQDMVKRRYALAWELSTF